MDTGLDGRFDQLLFEAPIAAALLANGDLTDIELVPLKPSVRDGSEVCELDGRGLMLAGVLGQSADGDQSLVCCDWAARGFLHEIRRKALLVAFARYCDLVSSRQKGDSADWLHRLWALEDGRNG